MGGQASTPQGPRIKLIEPNLYHIRAEFRVIMGLVNVGTHMSIVKLPNGKFLVIDTVPLDDQLREEIDELTNKGEDIEAVIATHPFHTLSFQAFHDAYPTVQFYGTPRHLRIKKDINWDGDITENLKNWESSGIYMRIPDGAEWEFPQPEASNHFVAIWVYIEKAKTIHVDDSVSLYNNPNWLVKAVGFQPGKICFHPAMKGPALKPQRDSPEKLKAWFEKVIEDWDFDNMVISHKDNWIGGAKEALRAALIEGQPIFDDLIKRFSNLDESKDNESLRDELKQCENANVEGNECG
jgi:hypothetical protein